MKRVRHPRRPPEKEMHPEIPNPAAELPVGQGQEQPENQLRKGNKQEKLKIKRRKKTPIRISILISWTLILMNLPIAFVIK